MKRLLTLFAILTALGLIPLPSFAQDIALRQRAAEMLARANLASSPARLPSLERVDNFVVLDASSGPAEGVLTRVVIQGTGRRDEATFGDYHSLDIWSAKGLATVRTQEVAPPEVATVRRLTPIYSVYFDHEDVVFAINDSSVDGRPARCIEFTTTGGLKTNNNEICIDTTNDTVVSMRLNDEAIENRDFFPFAGALMPGTIRYSYASRPRLEITQTMTALTNPTPNVLAAPPDAQLRSLCTTFRRAFGDSMPQPKAGSGGEDTDVLLRGLIGADGRVQDAVVQQTDRPDLNAEAIRVIRQWTFTPAVCDGKPTSTEASFVLHFQAR